MICQGIKRMEWQERLSERLFNVPYTHITFTLPHQINRIARSYPKEIYNLIMRSAWKTINDLCVLESNIGAKPGMIAVLHTWGSDLKHHIHVHTLVTFGGLKGSEWLWPKRKHKVASFRELCRTFRTNYLTALDKLISNNKIDVQLITKELRDDVEHIRWVVNHQRPTANTATVEEYLSRYICRSAITTNRIDYDSTLKNVKIIYKDYKHQKKGEPAPYAYKHLHPMEAIHQILRHKLPPYFHKCRYYGLHSTAQQAKIKATLPDKLKRNPETIRILFRVLKAKLGIASIEEVGCSNCESHNFLITTMVPDVLWPMLYIKHYTLNKSPPFPKSKNVCLTQISI